MNLYCIKDRGWPWSGRVAVNFGNLLGRVVENARFEWAPSKSVRARVVVDPSEGAVGASVGVLPVGFWLTLHGGLFRTLAQKLCPDGEERELSASADFETECVSGPSFGWYLWWSSQRDQAGWRHGYVYPLDFLLGRPIFSQKVLDEREVGVPMPEGVYRGKAALTEDTWRRPGPGLWQALGFDELPWLTERLTRVMVSVPQGVPVPGKGENAHDLDEGAIYDRTGPAASIEEGVGAFVGSALNLRRRRAGEGWRPSVRVRRRLPFEREGSLYRWEKREPLTGEWSSWWFRTEEEVREHARAVDLVIDERPCGCCRAAYGEPCTDPECPNRDLRRQS